MATDFTVIEAVRQHFGDDPRGGLPDDGRRDRGELWSAGDIPYVGLAKDFPFRCPSIDGSQWAVLQFLTFGVSYDNILRINGADVPGGITSGPVFTDVSPHVPLWNSEFQLIEPGLLGDENVLHIESVADPTGNYDDFVVDNVVIWFKTKEAKPGTRPTIGGAEA